MIFPMHGSSGSSSISKITSGHFESSRQSGSDSKSIISFSNPIKYSSIAIVASTN